jgi:hypothetical protein
MASFGDHRRQRRARLPGTRAWRRRGPGSARPLIPGKRLEAPMGKGNHSQKKETKKPKKDAAAKEGKKK